MRYSLIINIFVFILSSFLFCKTTQAAQTLQLPPKTGFDMETVEHGRYLIKIAGCNDCHTGGYLPTNGNVPVEQWLAGDTFGWRGPWGTTYGSNIRLLVDDLTEEEWVDLSKNLESRPVMPWFNLNAMKAIDLRSIYQFVKYLGPLGDPAPDYVPPGEEPKGPYALFPAPPQ